ncbi:TPA: hypothetical protein RQK32_000500 [Vibrio vulnificus]|nr:hypothetical protein [Vibrio vulnificus]
MRLSKGTIGPFSIPGYFYLLTGDIPKQLGVAANTASASSSKGIEPRPLTLPLTWDGFIPHITE